jgi:hypothetical protein
MYWYEFICTPDSRAFDLSGGPIMSFGNATQVLGRRFVAVAMLVALTAGCGGSSGNGPAGAGGSVGTGGQLGGAGGRGTGGRAGTGGAVVDAGPLFPSCAPLHADTASILSFDAVPAGSTQAMFGAFGSTFSGGTYEYPAPSGPVDAGSIGLTSDFSGGNWHITGVVGTYSGFGLYLACKSNVSAFTGLAFDVAGTFTASDGSADAGAPEPRLFMGIATPVDEPDSAHASNPPTWGSCTANCVSPNRVVLFGSANATVTTPWTSFTGGLPVDSLNPAEILSVFFSFPWNGAAPSPYVVDVTIDNIRFTTGTAIDASLPPDTQADAAAPTDVPADTASDASD